MAGKQPKSGAGPAFDTLAGKLVQVPKTELAQAEKRYQRRKERKRKKQQ
jgi:hypothetical protein